MEVDIFQLFTFFDDVSPSTNEERGIYWLETQRSDGLKIYFICDIFENTVSIGISNDSGVGIAGITLNKCSAVRVLDEKRKCLEVLH